MDKKKDLDELKAIVLNGDLSSLSRDDLKRFTVALCHSSASDFFNPNQFNQVCETIRLISMQKYMDDLDKKNTKLQYLVVAVSVMALVCTAAQVYIALKTPSGCTVAQQQDKQPQEPKPNVIPTQK